MNRELKVILFFIFTTGFSACACASTGLFPPYFPQDRARACFPDLEALKTGKIIAGCNWSWGENAGWLNVKASGADLQIGSNILSGKAWMENCGWVGFGSGRPFNGKRYGNASAWDWGVSNDGSGNLSGYAWSEVTGWINFSSGHSRLRIDKDGRFHGYAWGENVGWIQFGPGRSVQYVVKAEPGPWKAIGDEAGRVASGNNETRMSFASVGHVPLCKLNPRDDRYNQKAVSAFIDRRNTDAPICYIRFFEKPVYIDEAGGCSHIRGPPLQKANIPSPLAKGERA